MSIEKCKDFVKDGYGTWDDTSKPTTFANMYDFMKNQNNVVMNLASGIWQPATAYTVGAIIRSPSLPAGCVATCTAAGTSGTTEPKWTAYGTTVADGSCKWNVNTESKDTMVSEINKAIGDMHTTITGERNKAIGDMHTTITGEITKAINALHYTIKSEMKTAMLALFPVGTIIETEVDVNPGTYIGGTWEKMPAGYVTISAGTYTETQDGRAVTYDFKAGNTYGEAAHKLTVGELPSHIHANPVGGHSGWGNIKGTVKNQYALDINKASMNANGKPFTGPGVWSPTNAVGGNKYHNVMQPSFTVYRFKRVS